MIIARSLWQRRREQYHDSALILSAYSNLKVPPPIHKLLWRAAFVTDGGILLEDVYTQTLQAKLLWGRSFSLTSLSLSYRVFAFLFWCQTIIPSLGRSSRKGRSNTQSESDCWATRGQAQNSSKFCMSFLSLHKAKERLFLWQLSGSSQGVTDLGMPEPLNVQTLNGFRFEE